MMQQRPWRTRVKFCGLTREQDVTAAVAAGADAVGFVLYPKSKRAVSLEQAVTLRQQVPAFVTVTALLVNASDALIQEVLTRVKPDLLQFHGDETPAQCERYGHPYYMAIRLVGAHLTLATDAWVVDTVCE